MALAAGMIERHRERQRMDRLGTPTQIAGLVPLIVYIASNFAGAKKFRLKIEVRASNGQQTSDSFRSLRSIVSVAPATLDRCPRGFAGSVARPHSLHSNF